ncbi:hypothetical protein HPT27_08970 [Permianibacter sp. IMCC34836]|uniref:hypothetical protein n=1 Tax=Permianibacter fluminis TaxID=2738515 RepID=UPI001552922B|nr:hypothetical protein [Permianibacter fluminis]NQD37156.1 hypothetical protein [Permianibacter fluminis]
MKQRHLITALIASLLATPEIQANSMIAYAWSEVAFTAESGTHVEASVDKKGNLTRLIVVKHGKTFKAGDSVLSKITDAGLNDIAIYEEPGYEQVTVQVKANIFDQITGNATADIVWSIRIVEGKLYNMEYDEEPAK